MVFIVCQVKQPNHCMNKINWGIIAPGKIAHHFATALQGVESAHCYCVASRDIQRAQKFASKYDFERVAEDYTALITDPKVDVIYIASPHTFHAEQSIACLNAGKAVLCEKPMTINANQAQCVLNAAKQNNVFYMEAVWTRFMPIYQQVQTWINDGRIGDVQMLQASFAFSNDFTPSHRLYNAELAGGALLDLGIYPITFSQMVMQDPPMQVSAIGEVGNTHVDEQISVTLKYPNGKIANLSASISTNTTNEAWIFGSKGRIKLPKFWDCETATLLVDEQAETVKIPHQINGYEGEIEEVVRCIHNGLIESPILPWQESLKVMKIMDEARQQIGLKYPMER